MLSSISSSFKSLQLTPFESCFHGSLIGILFVCICCGRRIFWAGDALVQFVLGVALIFAGKFVVPPQTDGGSLDTIHYVALQALGAHLIAVAVDWFLVRNSRDNRMFARFLMARLFTSVLLSVAIWFSTYNLWGRKSLHFNQKFAVLYPALFGVSALGSLIHLYRNWPKSEGPATLLRTDWFYVAMNIDFVVLLFSGIVNFAFATQILKTLMKSNHVMDGVHVCFWRLNAAVSFGSAITSAGAAEFQNTDDQKSHVLARMLAQIFHFSWNLYGHFYLDVFSMFHVTPFMMSGFFITFLLSAYFRFPKSSKSHKKHVD